MKGNIPSTVLIGGDGQVVQHWSKVSVKGHVDEVLAAAQTL
jgi:peroxiredoxin